ncbi:glucokinase [Candidatus Woesearchaeota archaeon]|nr:glucokinase [Candidatus Woesearchaeota archaeon]
MQFEIKNYKGFKRKDFRYFLLAGDIGGTNTRLGLFGIGNKPQLLISLHFKSQELTNLSSAINKALEYFYKNHKINLAKASIAAAGPLSADRNKINVTNVKWGISKSDLLKKTGLRKILLLNDFEAIGYGINMISAKDVKTIKRAKKMPNAPIVLIGAGTGLGKTTLIFDIHSQSYAPIPSESGHNDFPSENERESKIIKFIRKRENLKNFVSFEHFLSGHGLTDIYYFLRKSGRFRQTKCAQEIDSSKNKPEFISKYRKADEICKETFNIFRETFNIFRDAYARFARSCALDSLAYGGVYITGKIAANNREIFGSKFIKSFEQNYKLAHLLKKIPIFLILNYNIGMLGAAFAYDIQKRKSLAL